MRESGTSLTTRRKIKPDAASPDFWDHTIHAEWAEIVSGKVEIIFASNTMTREDVEDFEKGHTNAKFYKFTVLKDAVAFVGAVRASSAAKGVVQKIVH